MTRRQTEIYNVIRDYIRKYGYSPTYREICIKTGIKSTATIHYFLKKLKEKGYIDYQFNRNRTIKIIDEKELNKTI